MLSGYRVLDLTDEKGYLCGKILGDLGADVIKIEPPGGDRGRRIGPFYKDEVDPDKSLYWMAFNGSKRGITLNLEEPEGRELFRALAQKADIIVESFSPGYLGRLTIGYDDLKGSNERLVMTSITPFGQTGPYRDLRASDIVILAMSGLASINGDNDRAPLRMCLDQSYYLGAAQAAAGTLLALNALSVTGKGQAVDVSIYETAVRANYREPFRWEWEKKTTPRMGNRFARGGRGYRQLWPCRDGYVTWLIMMENPRPVQGWVEWMKEEGAAGKWGEVDWDRVTSFRTWSPQEIEALLSHISRFMLSHPVKELEMNSIKRGLLLSPVSRVDFVALDEQLVARQFWKEVRHPGLGATFSYPRFTYLSSEGTNELRCPAPLIGEHNRDVYVTELGLSESAFQTLKKEELCDVLKRPESMTECSALEGVRVLDFTWAGAGPFATKFLADFGAEVVKVESSKRLDIGRMTPPFKDNVRHPDGSALFIQTNTGKMSITLNLRHPKAIQIIGRLVAKSDIVTENFTPGVMSRLGLSYDDLRKIKPDIIMASSSIYGQTGPKRSLSGFGNAGAAISGHYMLTGWPDREPVSPGIAYADVVQPVFTAIALLAALNYRRRTGRGQYIDCTQVETMVHFISPAMLDYFANGNISSRMGNRSPYAAPHGIFPCRGEERWCAIAVFDDVEWENLGRAMGDPSWMRDKNLSTFAGRKSHEDELEQRIAQWTARFDRDELVLKLREEGVTAGPVQDGSDLIDRDPQLKERQLYVRLSHPVAGECMHPGQPVKLSDTPVRVRTAPCLGQHNTLVYKEILGMTDAEYDDLLSEGVFD